MAVTIEPLTAPRRFLELQRTFYRDDPHFVPPMSAFESWTVDPNKNPFFAHGQAAFFQALRNARPVGRISAAIDDLHDAFHGDRIGFFGHFEAADTETAHALLDHAASWLATRDRTHIRGPIDLSTNYKVGLLIEGDPGPPILMMPHNPPVYAKHFESWGLAKAKDLLALKITERELDMGRINRLLERVRRRSKATLRTLDMKHFRREVDGLWHLYNAIWEKNWGFTPMSEKEFHCQAKDLRPIAEPRLLQVAEIDGKAVGFVVALPDANRAIHACNGRLLPLGWWKFQRAKKKIDGVRVITLGVLEEHRQSGIDMLLMHGVIEHGLELGYWWCEASWILEDNEMMIRPLTSMGFTPSRRYRVYERALETN